MTERRAAETWHGMRNVLKVEEMPPDNDLEVINERQAVIGLFCWIRDLFKRGLSR